MLSRRLILAGIVTVPGLLENNSLSAEETPPESGDIVELDYPPFEDINPERPFGSTPPTDVQRKKVEGIIAETPMGPTPVAIALSFVQRFATSDPKAISQWPRNEPWNPLVITFFESTSTPANNDMVPWCAAFANWCIKRAGKNGTRSASSQSFVESSAARYFIRTDNPDVGDLVVFTCYRPETGQELNLGHVAFLTGKPSGDSIPTVSGNTSKDGRYSIIAEKPFPAKPQTVYRTVNGTRLKTIMKVNTYLRIA
jgi:uncharacterized protein (TIGR02594 family)